MTRSITAGRLPQLPDPHPDPASPGGSPSRPAARVTRRAPRRRPARWGDAHIRRTRAPTRGPRSTSTISEALVRLLVGGETGGGEAYMDGLWSSPDLAGLLRWAALNRESLALSTGWFRRPAQLRRTVAHRLRRNTKRQSRRNIAAHYDLGNEFYRTFLDETMTYSSAVFATPDQSLADAQRNKYRLMAEGAGLDARPARPGDRHGLGRLRALRGRRAGLPGDVTDDLARAVRPGSRPRPGRRSRAAGRHPAARLPRHHRHATTRSCRSRCSRPWGPSTSSASSRSCDAALVPGGRLSLQSITFPDAAYDRQLRGANWIQTYIFPGGLCPSLAVIEGATRDTGLLIEQVTDIAADYVLTLRAWRTRFMDRRRQRSRDGLRRPLRADVGVLPRLERGRIRDGHQPGPADRVHETAWSRGRPDRADRRGRREATIGAVPPTQVPAPDQPPRSGRLRDRVVLITGSTGIAAATAVRLAAEGASRSSSSRARRTMRRALADRLGPTVARRRLAGRRPDRSRPRPTTPCGARSPASDGSTACSRSRAAAAGATATDRSTSRTGGLGPPRWTSTCAARSMTCAGGRPARCSSSRRTTRGPAGRSCCWAASRPRDPSPEMFATHAYAAAKGATTALMTAMAATYAADRIRVNVVAPSLDRHADGDPRRERRARSSRSPPASSHWPAR